MPDARCAHITDFRRHAWLVLFDDAFLAYGTGYARRHGRPWVVLSAPDEIATRVWDGVDTITFLGERRQFTSGFFQMACAVGVPFGIITARNKRHLAHQLAALDPFKPVSAHSPLVANLFASDEQDDVCAVTDQVVVADTVILGVHGDALCTSLGQAILCSLDDSADEAGERGERVPACVTGGGCFRRQRVGGDQARLVRTRDLRAEAVVLNTCAGLAITDTKYGDFAALLPLRLMEQGVRVFVSSYLIKHSTVHDVHLYWALLRQHESFAHATAAFNRISVNRLGGVPCFAMLGDAATKFAYTSGISVRWHIDQADEGGIVLMVDEHDGDTICLSVEQKAVAALGLYRDADLSGFIDAMVPATLFLESESDDRTLRIVVRFHAPYVAPFRIFLVPRLLFGVAEARLRSRAIIIARILRLDSEERTAIEILAAEIIKMATSLQGMNDVSELDARKYLMTHLITKKLEADLDVFEDRMSSAILKASGQSDSHLIVKDTEVRFLSSNVDASTACHECHNHKVEYLFRLLHSEDSKLIQTVCPRCEIAHIVTPPLGQLRCRSASLVLPGCTITVAVDVAWEIDVPFEATVGAILIGSSFGSSQRVLVTKAGAVLEWPLTIPADSSPGLRYLRAWLIGRGGISIVHKHLYVRSGTE